MRYSELIGLKWSDIDWTKGTIKVQRQLQYIPHKGYEFNDPKTRSGIRTIMLGESTLHQLKEHHRKYAHQDKTGENLIFVNGIGTKIYFKRFYKDFKRTLRNAGLPEIRFHDLRHTAATLMISNGIPVLIVSKILGHSKPSVTMNIYAHASFEMQSEATQLMENLVTPIPISIKTEQNQELPK
jgi:integrase